MGFRRLSPAALLVLLLGAAACTDARPPVTAKSLVLVSIDTLRADHLGCYGYPRPISPTLDALAAQGTLFEDASTTAPWTLPAHASLLTGVYPRRHGARAQHTGLAAEVPTLAEVLRRAGFTTGAFVNSAYLTHRYGLDRGFDDYVYVPEEIERVQPTTVGQAAMMWLAKRRRGERFFLFVHYYDVHSDYRSLPEYERAFVRPYTGRIDGSTLQLARVRRGQLALAPADVTHLADLYDAGIRQMDDGIAHLLRFLARRKLLDETLVVVTADHGEELLDHGGVLHGVTMYQEVLRVPLILRGPGVPAGHRVRAPVSLVDVVPTVLALLGVSPAGDLDGVDLHPWRGVEDGNDSRLLFAEADHLGTHDDVKQAARRGRFKLHLDRHTGTTALYDLTDDPGERVDVAEREPAVAAELERRLREFMQDRSPGSSLAPLPRDDARKLEAPGYKH